MEKFFEFNKEKHQRDAELINGVLLLAEDYISQNPRTVYYCYNDATERVSTPSAESSGLGRLAVHATVGAIEGLYDALYASHGHSIDGDKSNHRVCVDGSSQNPSTKTAITLTQLKTRGNGIDQLLSITVGDGKVHISSGILMTGDGRYASATVDRQADEDCYSSKAMALIEGGTDSFLSVIKNSNRIRGLKRPRSFDLIEGSLKYHSPQMNHEMYMEKLLLRYNAGLRRRNVNRDRTGQVPELTTDEIVQLKDHLILGTQSRDH